jgi:hypothetical protein
MIGITRYHISDGNHPSVEYVTYEDHLAGIAAHAAELAQARERATSLADLVQRMAKECNGELGCRAYQHYAPETEGK